MGTTKKQGSTANVHFDHHDDSEFIDNPQQRIRQLQELSPVFHSDAYDGFWVVTKYEDVHRVLTTPEVFSSYPINIPPQMGQQRPLIPVELDPPNHTRYRQLLAPFFSPARAESLTPLIREVAIDLTDSIVNKGRCEFIRDFAQPLPTRIFTHLVGLPMEEADKFLDWTYRILHEYTGDDADEKRAAAGLEVYVYFAHLIEEREERPRDDLVSYLVRVEDEAGKLTDEELLDICFLLFVAGLDTVAAALGFFLDFLARHPDHAASLRGDTSLVPGAVEELLRYHSFVSTARNVKQDVEIAGVRLREGERVLVMTGGAGVDEDEFRDALTVDFRRTPNRHLAFGAGPHRCLGSHLARRELAIALEELHIRTKHYGLDPEGTIRRHGSGVAGIDQLPLLVEAAGT